MTKKKDEEKKRWAVVGAMFYTTKQDEFSATLSFGLLGELRVWMKPDTSRAGNRYWKIVAMAEELPGLMALGPADGDLPLRKSFSRPVPQAQNPEEDAGYWAMLEREAELYVEPGEEDDGAYL